MKINTIADKTHLNRSFLSWMVNFRPNPDIHRASLYHRNPGDAMDRPDRPLIQIKIDSLKLQLVWNTLPISVNPAQK
ncbi:MAG TPA: hypothetical protein PKB02_15635, partial [Anaerohalosphaeraceae bacterium]|nr:hypothetical protein [Anaerohalosphaeraceae bacterium]